MRQRSEAEVNAFGIRVHRVARQLIVRTQMTDGHCLFDLLGPMAAQEFGQLAGFEVGTGEELLGQAGAAAGEVGAQAGGSRQTTVPQQQQQQAAVIQAIGSLAGLA